MLDAVWPMTPASAFDGCKGWTPDWETLRCSAAEDTSGPLDGADHTRPPPRPQCSNARAVQATRSASSGPPLLLAPCRFYQTVPQVKEFRTS